MGFKKNLNLIIDRQQTDQLPGRNLSRSEEELGLIEMKYIFDDLHFYLKIGNCYLKQMIMFQVEIISDSLDKLLMVV